MKNMMKNLTKSELVKQHLLKYKTITSWEAIQNYGATRLSAIIFNLRDRGFQIDTLMIEYTDRYGNAGQYAKYVLRKAPKGQKKLF